MSISGSLTRCSNHTQCRTDEYCARAEGIATGTPRCVHCQYCNDPTRPSSLDPFDHGDCPLQCRCQRHEDCDDDSYCARFNEFTQVCLSCRHCRGNRVIIECPWIATVTVPINVYVCPRRIVWRGSTVNDNLFDP